MEQIRGKAEPAPSCDLCQILGLPEPWLPWVVRIRCSLGVKPLSPGAAWKNHFLLQAVGAGVEGPVSIPRGDGPWECPGISQAFLCRISRARLSARAVYWGQRSKGKTLPSTKIMTKHAPPRPPILYARFPSRTSTQNGDEAWAGEILKLGMFFKTYLK